MPGVSPPVWWVMARNADGFDDAYSQDHDFGPRFCLWLTDEDYAAIGEQLEVDYEALPRKFSVDAQGA